METSVPKPPPFVGYPVPKGKWDAKEYNVRGGVDKLKDFFHHAAKILSFLSDAQDAETTLKINNSVKGFPDWLTGIDGKEDSFISDLTGSATGEQLVTSTLKAGDAFGELKDKVYDKLGGENMDKAKDLFKTCGDYDSLAVIPLVEAYNGIGAITGHLETNKTIMFNYIDGLGTQGLTDLAHKLGIIVNKADGTIDEDKTKKAIKKAITDNNSKLASFKAFNDNKLKQIKGKQVVRSVTPAVNMVAATMTGQSQSNALEQNYMAAKEAATQAEIGEKKSEAREAARKAKEKQPKKKEGVK